MMDDAANMPLPSRTASTTAPDSYASRSEYAASLHSIVDDNQSVNLTDWVPSLVDQKGRYRSHEELFSREDEVSRNESTLIQEFPLPSPRTHTRPETPSPLETKSSIEDLRRHLASFELPMLQNPNPLAESSHLNPIAEEPASYDLVAPYAESVTPLHSLEKQADSMFSSGHMLAILSHARHLFKFREFLTMERPRSVPVLTYYLHAHKALKAIQYANAVSRGLTPRFEIETSGETIPNTVNDVLARQAQNALQALTVEELPAFITSSCISLASRVVEQRVRGTLPPKFQGTADALAEVFCLTDPSRPDNPIIFASEEFHRTTQYGMDYVLGRNCRFLQGPKTNPHSVRRIREAIRDGRQHSEVFLNYRRDGSPFMNLLMCAPLCDSRGKVRYFIGAQIDVSGLIMDDVRMESMKELSTSTTATATATAAATTTTTTATTTATNNTNNKENGYTTLRNEGEMVNGHVNNDSTHPTTNGSTLPVAKEPGKMNNEFADFIELLNPEELAMVREHGGALFQPVIPRRDRPYYWSNQQRPRIMLEEPKLQSPGSMEPKRSGSGSGSGLRASLAGVYENYLLVRPYPSLRILFTSPSLRIPGILQSSFFSKVGGSPNVRDELLRAFMEGRSVTARVRWLNRFDDYGRSRWVHCTPLLANNGSVGVWMVVIVNDDEPTMNMQWKQDHWGMNG